MSHLRRFNAIGQDYLKQFYKIISKLAKICAFFFTEAVQLINSQPLYVPHYVTNYSTYSLKV